MDRDWSGPLDLRTVAAHAGYSPYHFTRAFRDAYGETPGQYLTRRRVERAQDMLRTANLSVTEICTLVGYQSLGTFSATFKRQTGLSPSQYRARHHHRGKALIPGCFALLWAGGFKPRPPAAGKSRPPAAGAGHTPGEERNSEEAGPSAPGLT